MKTESSKVVGEQHWKRCNIRIYAGICRFFTPQDNIESLS